MKFLRMLSALVIGCVALFFWAMGGFFEFLMVICDGLEKWLRGAMDEHF